MTIGAIILGLWQYFNLSDSLVAAPLVASALIAGDGVWSVPSAVLALAKVSPPLCAAVSFTRFPSLPPPKKYNDKKGIKETLFKKLLLETVNKNLNLN
jgi:hypothetical protein